MIYPPIEELTQGKYNRYTLVIATSKCARMVTDEYCEQREVAEKLLANKETDKSLASMIKREFRDEKAVKNAIKRLYQGEFQIVDESLDPAYQQRKIKEREDAERKNELDKKEASAQKQKTARQTSASDESLDINELINDKVVTGENIADDFTITGGDDDPDTGGNGDDE